MMALVLLFVLVTSLCVGYCWGRRAGTPAPTWTKRTSRVATGRLALNLVALLIARRVHRNLGTRHKRRPTAGGVFGFRPTAVLHTLWGDLARVRSR